MYLQYYAAFVLTNIVSSNKGVEFKNTAIPALVKLILTWHWFVQIQVTCLPLLKFRLCFFLCQCDDSTVFRDIFDVVQVLYALFNIANVFPDTCEDIVKNGALEHLESLLTNDKNHYALKSSGIQLLSALCRMNPLLCFDEVISCSIFPLKPIITYTCLMTYFKFWAECYPYHQNRHFQRECVVISTSVPLGFKFHQQKICGFWYSSL